MSLLQRDLIQIPEGTLLPRHTLKTLNLTAWQLSSNPIHRRDFQRKPAAICGEARRPSTRRTYNTHLRKYYRWCKRHKVALHSAAVGEVCEFLIWRFTQERANSNSNSIRSCKTAVGAVHHGLPGGSTMSSSTVMHILIEGKFHKRPPSKSLVSVWDLPRALRSLVEPPLEPLDQASRLDLSRKTALW